MENNANMVINFYRNQGVADETIAGILGNMQAESTIQPLLTEAGGGGRIPDLFSGRQNHL